MRLFLPMLLLPMAAMAIPAREDEASRAFQRAKEAQARSERRAASLAIQQDRSAAAAARADREASLLARQLGDAEAGVRTARRRAAAAAGAERAQTIRIAETRAPLAGMTAALARIARRPTALALAEGATIADAAHLALLIRHMRGQIAARNATLAEELARRGMLRAERTRAIATLEASRRLLDRRRLFLDRSRIDLIERSALLADAAEEERERGHGLAEESAALGSTIADMRRDQTLSARLAALPGPVLPPGAPSRTFSGGSGLYRLPRFGRVVAGTGEHDADGVRQRGLTLATAPGLSIVAPAAGRVLYAGPFRNYGDIVIIDHGRGWTSLIAGMSRTSTELGSDLFQGAHIGRSGRRMLIELRHHGLPVDVVAIATALRR